MKIAVVDDSVADRTELSAAIQKYASQNALLVCVTEYESGKAFLTDSRFSSFDAIFLDIYMDELNGMEVAYKIRALRATCPLVFVSTTPSFAVQSYDVHAFYYIVKPYEYSCIANVMEMLDKNQQKSSRYLKIKEGRDWCKILLADILYVDYCNHYVQIHTEASIVSTYMKFPEIEEKLLVFHEFLNCYRSIIVNLNKIAKVDTQFFLLCNGEYIPINRKRIKEIKSRYADYIFGTLEAESIQNKSLF